MSVLTAMSASGKHESFTHTNINFFFTWHDTRSDVENIAPLVEAAEVIFLECLDWSPKLQQTIDAECRGDGFVKDKYLINDAVEEILDLVHGTHKKVILFDAPKGHPAVKNYITGLRDVKKIIASFRAGKFKHAMELEAKRIEKQVKANSLREDLMIKNLNKSFLSFEDDETLISNALVVLGVYHTRVYMAMDNTRHTFSRYMPKPVVYSHRQEAERSMAFSGVKPDRLLVARALITHVLFEEISDLFEKGAELAPALRKLCAGLEIQDIKDLCSKKPAKGKLVEELLLS